MYVSRKVPECDFNGETYDTPQLGVAAIARGATGRWCEVMWGGPAYRQELIERGQSIFTYEQARKWVEENGQPGDYCDF